MNEFNILIGKFIEPRDIELIFGPIEKDGEFKVFPDNIKWSQLLKELGVMKSTSEASRNGWNKEIDEGFSDVIIGRRKANKRRITILKITKPIPEYKENDF